jgi:hypothetical protein
MSDQKDFEFLKETTNAFFHKQSIIKTINIIDANDLCGWERWLQIEFAKFCCDYEAISEWDREERYKLDRRISKIKSQCSIDFTLRQKHKHSWVALELKQINSASQCIKSMLGDVIKLSKIRRSQDDIRTIWCVGVHKNKTEIKMQGIIAKYEAEHRMEIKREQVYTKQIGKSAYSFTLF